MRNDTSRRIPPRTSLEHFASSATLAGIETSITALYGVAALAAPAQKTALHLVSAAKPAADQTDDEQQLAQLRGLSRARN